MIIGSLWYGPIFGKVFIRTQGWDKKSKEEQNAMKEGMTMTYVWQFITSLITFAVLNVVIVAMGLTGIWGGIQTALLMWLGFQVTFKFGDSLWGGNMTLFWLSAGCGFFTFLAAGSIIGAWQ